VDVDDIGCDFLSATGRKFLRAPRGTGFLYVRRDRIAQLEPPFLDLHAATWVAADRYEIRSDARRFESWESSAATRLGLGAAVDYLLELGIDAVSERIVELGAALRTRLGAIPGVEVHDRGAHLCGIVSFSLAGRPAADVAAALRSERVNVSVSSPTSARYHFEQAGLPDVVRASVHCYSSDEDLDRAADVLASL
jgi:selenocysteine lyase/cysteine desulfurase